MKHFTLICVFFAIVSSVCSTNSAQAKQDQLQKAKFTPLIDTVKVLAEPLKSLEPENLKPTEIATKTSEPAKPSVPIGELLIPNKSNVNEDADSLNTSGTTVPAPDQDLEQEQSRLLFNPLRSMYQGLFSPSVREEDVFHDRSEVLNARHSSICKSFSIFI